MNFGSDLTATMYLFLSFFSHLKNVYIKKYTMYVSQTQACFDELIFIYIVYEHQSIWLFT